MTVTVTDLQDLGLTLSNTSVNIDEGETASITVRPNSDPGDTALVVTLGQPDGSENADVTFTPATLTFTGGSDGNWNTTQSVEIAAAEDPDAIDETATLRLTAPGVDAVDVTVNVTDDEDLGVAVTGSPLTITEGGTATFTAKLTSDPVSETTVRLTSSNPDVTVSPTPLIFTGGSDGNWDTDQTVTVSVAGDDDAGDESATITLDADGVAPFVVDVAVDDSDELEFTLTGSPLAIDEGDSGTFSVRLSLDPGGAKTVQIEPNSASVTVNPSTLSFTAGNWQTDQTVTVTAPEDDDASNDSVGIALEAMGVKDGLVSVTVTDNDIAFVLTPGSLSVDEDLTADFTVALNKAPASDQTVSLAANFPDISLSQTSLTFTTANWSTAQSVTVNAFSDDDADPETGHIEITAPGVVNTRLSVTVVDDEVAFRLTPANLILDEGGSGSFSVLLSRAPTADQRVTLTTSNPDITLSPAAFTFTASNWNQPQSVSVTVAEDQDSVDADEEITLNAPGRADRNAAGDGQRHR